MSAKLEDELTNLNDLNDLFRNFDQSSEKVLDNSSNHNNKSYLSKNDHFDKENMGDNINIPRKMSEKFKKRRRVIKTRKSIHQGKSPIIKNSKATPLMFSPGEKSGKIISPDTRSKGSIQSRIELQNALKEAYAFLSEPDIKYEPLPKENTFNLK